MQDIHSPRKKLPRQVIPCWYVNEAERMEAIREKKIFKSSGYLTEDYFKIEKRIDGQYIEGFIGRSDLLTDFHVSVDTSYTYFDDFQKRNNIYFTFDKINLFKVTEVFLDNPIRFVLKRVDNITAFVKNQAFMIMPFGLPKMDKFYRDNISSFLKSKLNVTVYRADDFTDNDIIIETIHRMIEESEFVIADTTIANKNAFYEIGYASAMSKEIITIQDFSTEQKLFFDRSHIRTINYNMGEVEKFQFELLETIKSIRSRLM